MKELLKAKSEFRKKGIVLIADKRKEGMGGSWKFAGEDNLIKTIQQPLIDCGLEIVSTMQEDSVKVTLWHIGSGESIEMYLDAEIERGKQFGYWSRILTIRILGLSDIDPEDMNNRPLDLSDDTADMRVELDEMISSTKDSAATTQWICKNYKVEKISMLNGEQLKHIINLLKQKAKE